MISAVINILLAVTCCVISILQFKEKGFLFNNAYLFASKQEREKMDKTPHYRQSGIVFAFLTIIFACFAVEVIAETEWVHYLVWILVAVVIIYAIISSIKLMMKE